MLSVVGMPRAVPDFLLAMMYCWPGWSIVVVVSAEGKEERRMSETLPQMQPLNVKSDEEA
jgi:hypothetical protein